MCLTLETPFCHVDSTDEYVIAVPLRTRVPGNLLAIPRRHSGLFIDLPLESAQQLVVAAGRAARLCALQTRPDGINTWLDGGGITGEAFGHVAFEVVPRFHDVRYEFVERPQLAVADEQAVAESAAGYRELTGRTVAAGVDS